MEKPSKRHMINMLNYFESPFMGNIETLIKFYSFIHEFEDKELKHELLKLEAQEATKTLEIFNNMLYTLLNHILKIIAALTNKLSPNDNPKIKDSLLNYSVAIVYRLSKFIRGEIDAKVDELNNLDQDILRIEAIRMTLATKIDSVQRAIDKQGTEIDIVLRNFMMFQMMNNGQAGGSDLIKITTKNSSEHISDPSSGHLSEQPKPETKESSPKSEHRDSTQEANEDNRDKTDNQDLSKYQQEGGAGYGTSPEKYRTSSDPRPSGEKALSSIPDTSHIYNFNSDTAQMATLSNAHKGGRGYHSEQLGLSDLLSEVNKLKSVSEKKKVTSVSAHSDKSSHKTSDKKSERQSEKKDSSELSGSVAESLSDILSIHNKIDFSTESDNLFQYEGDGTSSQIKYLTSSNQHGSTSVDNIFVIE